MQKLAESYNAELSISHGDEYTSETNTTINLKFYAIQACGQITDIAFSDTPQSWFMRVKDLLEEDGIVLEESSLSYEIQEHVGFCGNCERTGDVLAVSVTREFEQALRNLGFTD